MTVHRRYELFDPRTYLYEYYAAMPPENVALLRFLVRSFADVPEESLTLDFGSGPTLYTPIAGAHRIREMHMCEYLDANRAEVERWLRGELGAFDWSATIRTAIRAEHIDANPETISERERVIRAHVTRVTSCNLLAEFPLEDRSARGRYDVLVSNLCAEAASPDLAAYRRSIAHFADLLRPGGRLILSSVRGGQAYTVGDRIFAVLPLTEQDVADALSAAGFISEQIKMDVVDATHPVHPYDGLMFFTAHKG